MKFSPIGSYLGALCLSLSGLAQSAPADIELRKGTAAHFATAAEGAEILGSEDDFIERLSPFDRAARMKTDRSISTAEFLRFVRANVATWTETEKGAIEAATAKLQPELDALALSLPKTISFIKTTGAEEGNAFYTRDTAVVFPQTEVQRAGTQALAKTIAHELFHILSRQNPELREALYNAIGFKKCAEVELPPELKSRKITNPDAPRNDHSIRLKAEGEEVTAVPVLYAKSEKYDPSRGGEFFNYLEFNFLVRKESDAASVRLLPPAKLTGFSEQVGSNTDYIIHPEEILAENFALLVVQEPKIASPEILQRMRAILADKKATPDQSTR